MLVFIMWNRETEENLELMATCGCGRYKVGLLSLGKMCH